MNKKKKKLFPAKKDDTRLEINSLCPQSVGIIFGKNTILRYSFWKIPFVYLPFNSFYMYINTTKFLYTYIYILFCDREVYTTPYTMSNLLKKKKIVTRVIPSFFLLFFSFSIFFSFLPVPIYFDLFFIWILCKYCYFSSFYFLDFTSYTFRFLLTCLCINLFDSRMNEKKYIVRK